MLVKKLDSRETPAGEALETCIKHYVRSEKSNFVFVLHLNLYVLTVCFIGICQ